MSICFDDRVDREQARIAAGYGSQLVLPDPAQKVWVAGNVRHRAVWPINGMRHQPEGDTCGWYIWAGEDLSQDPDSLTPVPQHTWS
jgi:hypothetical protein